MNRNIVYFTQRVLSAAANAAVYVIADMISQQARQKDYTRNRNTHNGYKKPTNSRKISYTEYAKSKTFQPHRTEHQLAGKTKQYKSMNEQVRERRKKGLN